MNTRRQDIEALRLLSAFGIVWFHTGTVGVPGGGWGYAGLVAFLALSVQLGGRRGQADAATLKRRARRLLLPWACWFGIYGLWNAHQGLPLLAADQHPVAAVLAGTSIHLWYLPFMFMVLVGLDVLKAHAPPALLSAAAGGLAIAGVASAPWWRPISLGWPYPLLQWADAAAPVLLGVFLSGASALPRALRLALSAGVVLAAAAILPFQWLGLPMLLGSLAALLVHGGGLAGRIRIDLRPASDCTLGIYLCHSLVFALLLQVGGLPAELLPLAIFGLSLAGVALLQRAWPRAAAVLV
jgi:hypothetical protein